MTENELLKYYTERRIELSLDVLTSLVQHKIPIDIYMVEEYNDSIAKLKELTEV